MPFEAGSDLRHYLMYAERMKILLLILCLGLSQIVHADEFDDAVTAFNKGDFVTAFQGFKKLAEQGVPHAQTSLGLMYDYGHGVTQDYKEAAKWYRKAAELGHVFAQYNLGVMYNEALARVYRVFSKNTYTTKPCGLFCV